MTGPAAPDSTILTARSLPPLFAAADRYAVEGQRRVQRLTAIGLGASIAAAAFGAASIRRGDIEWAGILSAAAFVTGTAVTAWLVWGQPQRRRQRARAAAEEVRSLAWCYVAGGGSFRKDDRDGEQPQQVLLSALEGVARGLRDLPLIGSGSEPAITQAMEEVRTQTLDERRRAYVKGRIATQLRWYEDRAKANTRAASRASIATIVLSCLGALFALARGVGVVDRSFLGVAVAAIGAVTAWSRTREYDALARSYAVTAHQLAFEAARASGADDETAWAAHVDAAEHVMRREHVGWLERRGFYAGANEGVA